MHERGGMSQRRRKTEKDEGREGGRNHTGWLDAAALLACWPTGLRRGRDGRPPTDSKGSQCGPLQHCNYRSAIGMPRPRRLQHIFAPPKNDRRARPTGRVNRFRSPPQWALRSAVCCSALHCPLIIVAAACPHTGTIRITSGHASKRGLWSSSMPPLPLPPPWRRGRSRGSLCASAAASAAADEAAAEEDMTT